LNDSDIQDLLVGIVVFALTYVIAQFYTGGDQVGYMKAYQAVRGLDPVWGFHIYRQFISTAEFGHYLIIYTASNLLIEKNLVFSLLNGVLALLTARAFRALNVNYCVSLSFIFLNYYIYVLYFAAERLKLSFIFLLLGVFFIRSVAGKYSVVLLAVTSHVTVVLLIAGRILEKIFHELVESQASKVHKATKLAVLLAVFAILAFLFKDYAYWKFYQYFAIADNSAKAALPLVLCFAMSVHYSKNKLSAVFDFLPLAIAFALLGGSRVNMFAYLIFLRHGIQSNRGVNLGVLATTAYLAYKSAVFIWGVIETGQGF
jgi:uncharacterized membrane protein YidH (DUF202 family)